MRIVPAHFLTVPLEQFREDLETISDIHYVLKITKVGGQLTVNTYPVRASLDSKFCLETSEMSGSTLCYISTGIFGFGAGPVCKHSAIKSFHTVHDTRNCPQMNGSLELFGVCESSLNIFKEKKLKTWQRLMEIDWEFNVEPSLHLDYKIETTLGTLKTAHSVSHELLCKYNGILPLGSLPATYRVINCKNIRNCMIEFVAFEKKDSEEFQEKLKFLRFYRCDHDHPCNAEKEERQTGQFVI